MVHLYSIIIYKWREHPQKPIQLAASYELSSFNVFTRGTAKEILQFVSLQVVGHSKPGDRHGVLHKEHFCHVIVKQDKLAIAICTDKDYPQQVANSLMLKCVDGFANVHGDKWASINADTELPTPQLQALLQRYQNPDEADDIARINRDLQDTKEILVKTIDQLLERGEKLDDLMDSAENLSFQGRAFMKQAEGGNCCTLL